MDRYYLRIGALVGLLVLLCLLVLALAPEAAAYEEYTNNENPGDAIWIESPTTMGPVHVWRLQSGTNLDWWRFNASEGQHIEIRYRKYTPPPDVSGLPTSTYYIKWDLWGPYVSTRNVYSYEYTTPWGGQPQEYHRRDTFDYVVPKGQGGNYFIHVWIDPPGGPNPYREGFYWLNLTLSPVPELDTTPVENITIAQHGGSDYDVNYNFADMYYLDLSATATEGDLVTLTLNRGDADHRVYMEAWETIPFGIGGGENDHMTNRSLIQTASQLTLEFTATHSGIYYVRVYRDFYSIGDTTYRLALLVQRRPLEDGDLAASAVEISRAGELNNQGLTMGYDNHDWYSAKIYAGDRLFGVVVDITDPNLDVGHGFELVVYNTTGQWLWSVQNRVWVGGGPSGGHWEYRTQMELPPAGTPTNFETDETYYIRVSIDPAITADEVVGFKGTYDIEFLLSNRPPMLVEPFEPSYTWPEDTTYSIELDSHFSDVDGDAIQYTVFNKTLEWKFDPVALSQYGYLNITPPANWYGEVWWRLMAIDAGQTADSHKIYVDLRLIVTSVPDRPVSKGPISLSCDEEGSASTDLSKTFSDVDKDEGGILHFGFNDTGQTDVAVTVNATSGAMTLVPAVDVFGVFTFEVWCHDDILDYVTETVTLTVRNVNDVPRITSAIPPVVMDEGDDPVEIDLNQYFHDVDDEALVYSWAIPSQYSADLNVYHKNNVATESHIIIELLDPHFYAHVTINITAKDPKDTTVKQNLVILISNVPDPPTISYTPVNNPPDIDEGGSVTFTVTDVLDPDVPEFGLHTYTWYLDNVMLQDHNESVYIYRPGFNDSGPHNVRVVVTDPAGLEAADKPDWSFNVRDLNRNPTADITTAPTTLKETEKLTLTVAVDDPDGDTLTINWYLVGKEQDKLLGTEASIQVKLPAGTQTIEVEVEDGKGGKAVDQYSIKVQSVDEDDGLSMMMLGIIIVIVVVVLVAVGLLMAGRKPKMVAPEAEMDLDSLEKDYESKLAGGGGGGEYDPTPKDWEEYERLK